MLNKDYKKLETTIEIKIYYEDTDCLGIVYHANYLKYFERARTEFFNTFGKPIQLWNKEGYNFVVYEMNLKFKQAAKLGDVCTVTTKLLNDEGEYRKTLEQRLLLNDLLVTEAIVDLVCLDKNLELIPFPLNVFN